MKKINKKGEDSRSFFRSKKGDIAITILVIAVLVLCIASLLSFHFSAKSQIKDTVKSAYFLQDTYNLGDSVKYSGLGLIDKYDKR